MGLAALVRGALVTINQIVNDLEVDVIHEPWMGEDEYGAKVYGTSATYRALVEPTQKQVVTTGGRLAKAQVYIAILAPIPYTTPNAGFVRQNPVDPNDRITLPDGTVSPILSATGFLDGGTGKPFYSEIYLGETNK